MRRRKQSRGAILFAALICMVVVMMIAMTLVHSSLGEHRQSRRRELELQSLWLAESAAERAVARMKSDPAYRGETWRPTVAASGGEEEKAGVAVIRVNAPAEGGQKVIVEARYPDDPTWGVVSHKEIVVEP